MVLFSSSFEYGLNQGVSMSRFNWKMSVPDMKMRLPCIRFLSESVKDSLPFCSVCPMRVSGFDANWNRKALKKLHRETGMIFQRHQLIERQSDLQNVLMGRFGYHSVCVPCSHNQRQSYC
jgi:hypothetical protein